MMSGAGVLYILDLLAAVGVPVWADGGWGVDALLGEQTRLHDDLDLALEHRDLARFLRAMDDARFRVLGADGPFHKVLIDQVGRKVDYHVFDASATRRREAGVIVFGPMGLEYEVGAFEGRGTIPGRAVVCCTVEFQVRSHTGYGLD
jgi:lincosamide nucleotidyltransferase A/C/D/E